MAERLSVFGRVLRSDHPAWNQWATWVTDPGSNNLQDTFEGGEPADIPVAVVDLSAAASAALGQQVAQSASYRLRGVTVAYRAQDDGLLSLENESEAAFQGVLQWFAPTDHFKEAMTLARKVEAEAEADDIDSDSFFLSTDNDYKAMRMDWGASYDATVHPTQETVIGINGGTWNLTEVASAYNAMTVPVQSNALFNGRFPGVQQLGWNATISSGPGGLVNSFTDFNHDMFHGVGMGLMRLLVTHSTMASQQGIAEDDYQWYVGFDFEVGV